MIRQVAGISIWIFDVVKFDYSICQNCHIVTKFRHLLKKITCKLQLLVNVSMYRLSFMSYNIKKNNIQQNK